MPAQDFDHLRTLTAELTQKDQELKESEARLRLALEAANIGMWHWCLSSNALIWDRRMFEMFRPEILTEEFDPEECENNYNYFVGCLHPEDRDRVNALVEQCIVDKAYFNTTYRVIHCDGTVRKIKALGQVMDKGIDDNDCGNPCMTGVCIDITDEA